MTSFMCDILHFQVITDRGVL